MSDNLRLQRRVDWLVWALTLAFGVFAMHEVQGATPPAASRPSAPTPEAIHRRECGDCHLAYASQLLPAATWRQIMAGLDHHFGVDASLDPAAASAISSWLVQSAASPGRSSRESRDEDAGASRRITTTRWFVREHREVPASTWRRAAIGSAANCAACHTDALQGRFGERALRIPN